MERHSLKLAKDEVLRPNWAQFKHAFQTFTGDLGIVNHSETPFISPFDATLEPDPQGNRQYNVTILPPPMTEEQFLAELQHRTVIKIGCMDRDASGPDYESLTADEQAQQMRILMAGGVVQIAEERMTALKTIISYLGDPEKSRHIKKVQLRGHDNTCGYVKFELDRTELAPGVSLSGALHVTPGHKKEDIAMKKLILNAAQESGALQAFGNRVELGLEVIDRNGGITVDTDFDHIEATPLEALID